MNEPSKNGHEEEVCFIGSEVLGSQPTFQHQSRIKVNTLEVDRLMVGG